VTKPKPTKAEPPRAEASSPVDRSDAKSDNGGKEETATAEAPNEREYLEKLLVSANPKDRSTTDFYSFGKVVGTGSFAKVRVARHKLTGQLVAIKTYEKAKIKDANALKRIHQEIKVMEALDHPLISRFFESIESAKRIHLVMEFLGEGNLCTYIKDKRKLGEDESRSIFSQLCMGLEYMHNLDIVHRDIKLENVLFDPERNAKLIDFGFSVPCKADKRLKVFCGTPSYVLSLRRGN
jgi:serine/threonine protein kinase